MTLSRRLFVFSAAAIVATAPAYASHPNDFANVLPPLMQARDTVPAEKMFLKDANSSGRNQLLYLYEMASLYRMAGNTEKSIELFKAADAVAHDYEGKAVVSAGASMGQVGATLTNDSLLTWEGAVYDKVMSRTLNAMNFLAKQDLESAQVEVKKAEEYQSQERDRIQKAVAKGEQKDQKAAETAPAALGSNYNEMYSFARNVRNSYENAFTYYLSSQIYSAQGHADDAFIDIARAYELAPQVPAIQTAYLDMAARAKRETEVAEMKARLGVAPEFQFPDRSRTGTVVVLFEAGFVPPMSEVSINLPVSGQLFTMAFPIYNNFKFAAPALLVQTPGGAQTTTKVVDMRQLAVKSLQERMPSILTRSTLGAVAKIQAQKEVKKQFGFFGGLAASIASKLVTVADLRSWLSLPAEMQSAQFALQPGPTELTLTAYDWTEKVAMDVAPGSYTFVMVKAVPGFKAIRTVSLAPPQAPVAVAQAGS
jgi:hypothetical protein